MQIRLLLFIPITLLSLFLAIMEVKYSDEVPWGFLLIAFVGLYGIWYALSEEIRFKLAEGFLVIDAPLRNAERLNMKDTHPHKKSGNPH